MNLKKCIATSYYGWIETFIKKYLKNRCFIILLRIASNFIKIKPSQIKFREGKFAIVPYVEFKLASKNEKLKISRIIVGPDLHKELSKKSVDYILSAQNINNVLVDTSPIPFRG